MIKAVNYRTKTFRKLFFGLVFVQIFSFAVFAQTKSAKASATPNLTLPKVTQVDGVALTNLLKPNGKPLLVNFWATWCDPCREEFPDLVKIDTEYKGKLDFITVSLDDLADIDGDVPKFLASMKAEMPAYLLKTTDEDAAISSVSKDWQGALPFTILYDANGKTVYSRMGKVKIDVLRTEIEKSLSGNEKITLELPKPKIRSTNEGKSDAEKDIAAGILRIKKYGLTMANSPEYIENLKSKYRIEIVETGCILLYTDPDYFTAYNAVMKAEIKRKFGVKGIKDVEVEVK